MKTVLISIGSNQGDSVAIARGAIRDLRGFAAQGFRASSLWRTSPVNCPPGSPDFINASVAFTPHCDETPESLLASLKRLERGYGRVNREIRNAPRLLDLDLILFGDEVREGPEFTLPHPRAIGRRFVLEPSAEVAPALLWPTERPTERPAEQSAEGPAQRPTKGRTIAELRRDVRSNEVLTRLDELATS
ncbi:MAG: 2-amino-4-hydroxy-6-hydroxymethyldihydropteridine diphosphokinase [Gammaproteobacteria bacterium]|nr:2-amino-4-hydroxy-6-hydroxymethyldihydropteridine diphosphokinase [Gammaproteobacteria bacterium]